MNTATKAHRLLSSRDYAHKLVDHYAGSAAKPRLAHYPQIKRDPHDASLSDEMLFDLNALLLRLLHLQNECDANWTGAHTELNLARDATEAALGRFIGSQLSRPTNEPLIPLYRQGLDVFTAKLKIYIFVVQLYRSRIPFENLPRMIAATGDARLVLDAIESHRTRLLESFQALRRNGTGWLERSMKLIK